MCTVSQCVQLCCMVARRGDFWCRKCSSVGFSIADIYVVSEGLAAVIARAVCRFGI